MNNNNKLPYSRPDVQRHTADEHLVQLQLLHLESVERTGAHPSSLFKDETKKKTRKF